MRPEIVLFFALGALGACSTSLSHPVDPRPGEVVLRIATYNVNYGLAGDRATMEAIIATKADVIVLQETTPAWQRALKPQLPKTYKYIQFRHNRGAGGMAVISRYPIIRQSYISAPTRWFPGWRIELKTPLGRVQVLQVHLHPMVSDSGSWVSGYFTTSDERLKEISAYVSHLDPKIPTLVLGDFNESGGDAISLLKRRGFKDAVHEFNADDETWRWQTSVGKITLALDHVFYSPQLRPLRCDILKRGRSDHLPVVALFTRKH
ncbi:MAG: endonuclease/exonuclease/phosphatase family protein [Deltaproteobacteria bacterium]|nr:endonuclease/exonuclease/phosphatase family protein [Deltaproteobacteria bacterium]